VYRAYSVAEERARKLRDPSLGLPYAAYVLPAAYASFSALFGTFSVVLAKVKLCAASTLKKRKGCRVLLTRSAALCVETAVFLFRR